MACECDKIGTKLFNLIRRKKPVTEPKKFLRVTRWRSFVKGCCWEFMCFFILGTIVYRLTGRWEDVGTVVVAYHLVKVVLYYWHERAWQKVTWGLKE